MAQDRFKLSAAAYLLLFKEDKILLLRRFNTGWADGLYSLPSGHINGNEPLSQALCREAKEEVGIDINPSDIRFAKVIHRMSDKEYLDFFFTTEKWQGEPYNAEPEKSDHVGWFSVSNLPKNIVPHVEKVIADHQKNIPYIELNW